MKRLKTLLMSLLSSLNGKVTTATVSIVGKGRNVAVGALEWAETQTAQAPDPPAILPCGWECTASNPLNASTSRTHTTAAQRSSRPLSNWLFSVTAQDRSPAYPSNLYLETHKIGYDRVRLF